MKHTTRTLPIHRRLPYSAAFVLLAASAAIAAEPGTSGVVPEGFPVETPALVAMPYPGAKAGLAFSAGIYPHGETPNVEAIAAQAEPADPIADTPARIWFQMAAHGHKPGAQIDVRLVPSAPRDDLNAYRTRRDDEHLHVAVPGGLPVLSYRYGQPVPNPKNYPLTDFVHPLVGLDGEILTAQCPKDHIHHRGIFWAWVRHEQDGKSLGTWWTPDTVHLEFRDLTFSDGPVFSRLAARHDWVYQPKDSLQGRPFMSEHIVCRVFRTTPHGRAIDFDITLSALVDGIRLGGTTELNKGYGGFTFRYGPAADAKIVADGKPIPKDLNHLRANWADWTGIFKTSDGNPAGRRSGVAILVDPSHPDSPPEWITRLYGVLNVSYPGLRMIDLPKGKPLRLKYRLWIHRGDTKEGNVEDQYRAYDADWKWKATKAD